mmetsp:Transcript_8498/g.21102  ORF Transcript_8498/g.21102 Transcript_8498/m.21102 type:complete len:464 (-) Transcript_8498:329-1720(-)
MYLLSSPIGMSTLLTYRHVNLRMSSIVNLRKSSLGGRGRRRLDDRDQFRRGSVVFDGHHQCFKHLRMLFQQREPLSNAVARLDLLLAAIHRLLREVDLVVQVRKALVAHRRLLVLPELRDQPCHLHDRLLVHLLLSQSRRENPLRVRRLAEGLDVDVARLLRVRHDLQPPLLGDADGLDGYTTEVRRQKPPRLPPQQPVLGVIHAVLEILDNDLIQLGGKDRGEHIDEQRPVSVDNQRESGRWGEERGHDEACGAGDSKEAHALVPEAGPKVDVEAQIFLRIFHPSQRFHFVGPGRIENRPRSVPELNTTVEFEVIQHPACPCSVAHQHRRRQSVFDHRSGHFHPGLGPRSRISFLAGLEHLRLPLVQHQRHHGEEFVDFDRAALVEVSLLHQSLHLPRPERVIPQHLLYARAQLSVVDRAVAVLVEARKHRLDRRGALLGPLAVEGVVQPEGVLPHTVPPPC